MRDDNPATERQTRQAIRDDIYERIRRGDLGPAEGEAEAASLGLKPFENIPAEGEFDPFEAARWSLPMAFAWAMWGTRASVRRHWQAYREADLRWRPCDLVAPSGPIAALLGPLRPTSALDLLH